MNAEEAADITPNLGFTGVGIDRPFILLLMLERIHILEDIVLERLGTML